MRTVEADPRVLSTADSHLDNQTSCHTRHLGNSTEQRPIPAISRSPAPQLLGSDPRRWCRRRLAAIAHHGSLSSSPQVYYESGQESRRRAFMRHPAKLMPIGSASYRISPLASIMALIMIASLLPGLATAAFIEFENCLPGTYVNNDPKLLQWKPLYVDASFDTESPRHTLKVTMWGNVTGKSTNVTLPPGIAPSGTTNPGRTVRSRTCQIQTRPSRREQLSTAKSMF